MTFYVEKRLPLGAIRFGVTPNRNGMTPDNDSLSTGASGEFIRRRTDGFFFGGHDRFAGPAIPEASSVTSTPFWPAFPYGFIALMLVGFLLTLIGFAVIGRKGPQGWVEVILGASMIATPIVMTAQKRRRLREQEQRERAQRPAIDKKNRELLAAFAAALERARTEHSDEAFDHLQRERERLPLPYEIWGPAARRTVLLIGFDDLPTGGQWMERAARAAGLSESDQYGVRRDLTHTIVWHLIADNRLAKASAVAAGSDDARTIEQFRRLEGLKALPRVKCSTKLEFREYCIYETPTGQGTLHVTNRRLIIESKKPLEVPIGAFDVIANPDESVVTIKTEDPKKPLRLRVEEPIYATAILDAASAIDERPRGFS